MFMKQVVQKWNCLYCFTETHFICKNTAISSKKKNLGGGCKEGDKLDKNELLFWVWKPVIQFLKILQLRILRKFIPRFSI